jgi:antitoxin VapB
MKQTRLSAAPGWMEVPPNALRRFAPGRTASQLIASVRRTPSTSTNWPLDSCIDAVYISRMKRTRAKLFQNGGSQAVRLPKECRFVAEREVLVHREGRRVILEPADEWSKEFRASLGSWPGDIPRPKGQKIADLRNPFD